MKHLKRYNESIDHPSPYTWDELLYRIETGECKLAPSRYSSDPQIKEETIESIKINLDRISKRNPDINTEPIIDSKRIHDGICEIPGEMLVVFDENLAPVALLWVGDMMNPFVFGDVVIAPGHDYIACYNKSTGEFTKQHIG